MEDNHIGQNGRDAINVLSARASAKPLLCFFVFAFVFVVVPFAFSLPS
jgi:hypothetical protein